MNQVVLIGRLTKDVETKVIPSTNTTVANFTLAVNRDLAKSKVEELKAQGKPTADFIRIIAFGKTAEACADYLEKGRLVAIHGAIQTSTFKGKDGETRYSTDVLANKGEQS